MDTAIVGHYNIISCSDPTEATGVVLTVRFVKMTPIDEDTLYLYKVINNTSHPGEVQLSKSWIFLDENTNHLEPTFEEKNGKINNGFHGSQKILMTEDGNKKSGDTLILNFFVHPQGQDLKLLTCRYLKG